MIVTELLALKKRKQAELVQKTGLYAFRVDKPNVDKSNAVWSKKYNSYLAIRKLTPKECFRLQGWTDDYFEKAELMNSNCQLYKQAGNGVTVNVVKEIGERLWTKENL